MANKLTAKQREENYLSQQRQRKHEHKVEEWVRYYPFDPFKNTITGKDWRSYKQARRQAKDQLKSLNSVKRGL